MQAPQVPDRVSSKDATGIRVFKRKREDITQESSERLHDSFLQSQEEEALAQEDVKLRREVSGTAMFSKAWWQKSADAIGTQHKILGLQNKASWDSFQQARPSASPAENLRDWANQKEVQETRKKMRSAEQAMLILDTQADRIDETGGVPQDIKKSFWEMFLKSHNIIDPKLKFQLRPDNKQTKARTKSIAAYDVKYPDPEKANMFYCPILDEYFHKAFCTAAHIFPCSYGAPQMAAIFGKGMEELMWEPENVVMMSTAAEKAFDKHYFTLEPAVSDRKDPEEARKWQDSPVRQWKIKVIVKNDQAGMMDENHAKIGDTERLTLASRDGKLVKFKPTATKHPKGRFLYFHNAIATLTHRGPDLEPEKITDSGGEVFFGTVGSYLQRSVLTGAADYLGHEFAVSKTLSLTHDPKTGTDEELGQKLLSAASVHMAMRRAWNAPDRSKKAERRARKLTFETELEGAQEEKRWLTARLAQVDERIHAAVEALEEVNVEIKAEGDDGGEDDE